MATASNTNSSTPQVPNAPLPSDSTGKLSRHTSTIKKLGKLFSVSKSKPKQQQKFQEDEQRQQQPSSTIPTTSGSISSSNSAKSSSSSSTSLTIAAHGLGKKSPRFDYSSFAGSNVVSPVLSNSSSYVSMQSQSEVVVMKSISRHSKSNTNTTNSGSKEATATPSTVQQQQQNSNSNPNNSTSSNLMAVSSTLAKKSPSQHSSGHHYVVTTPKNMSSLNLNEQKVQSSSASTTSDGHHKVIHPSNSSANSNISRASSTTTRKQVSTIQPRFIMTVDGNHEHHLRNSKRQEKVGQMLKDWLGGKKLRSEAVSAIPNILSSTNLAALDKEAKDTVDAVNLTASNNHLPPTLFSSLLNQVKRGDITQYSGCSDQAASLHNQPANAVSVLNNQQVSSVPVPVAAVATTVVVADENNAIDHRSFAEKYGKCQEVVGRGAFGVVRIAHKKTENGGEVLFAVKEFKRRPTESEKRYSSRLTNEFCISSSLKHKNIISSYDLLRDAKSDYCEVMEYCSGGDLYSLIITAGKLEYAEADCFFKQLIKAVHYMHEMGVAHRDLKPENILITNNGVLKITDFGNAECFRMAWEDDIQLSRGICGSSPYIAPEEYVTKEFDPRAVDIWACGVIYMAMRTGRQLWKQANLDDEFYSIFVSQRQSGKYAPIEALKRVRSRNVIYSILNPDPIKRITGKEILNSRWVRDIKLCKAASLEKGSKCCAGGKSSGNAAAGAAGSKSSKAVRVPSVGTASTTAAADSYSTASSNSNTTLVNRR
ncbi:unnamed protein product [Ambrosiozyma monospora]|uniref:Unnamed protein product n=1 Tax=Ambrosiozyma monospora TaxID=43982 RepID=A0ACB5SRT7_AMBMO|nr:unnamed protein product [Ambrosiozyma monospora]